MRVSGLELFHLRLPLVRPFEISTGRLTQVSTILVRLFGEGEEGWGEAPPWDEPIYGPETAQTAFHILRDILAPRVVGRAWDSPEALAAFLGGFRGNFFAKAALETAWWVLEARLRKVPLHRLLGGEPGRPIECGVSLGVSETPGALVDEIDRSLALGYRRVKIKVKPGWDVVILEKVRGRFPKIPLQVDANAAYTLEDLETLRRFDDFQLVQIEQPLAYDDLVDHATLQRELRTPICLDESVKTADDARKALSLGSCRIVNIKLTRVGGLHEARKIHDLCRERDVPCWVGGMLESAIGEAICMEFATLPNIRLPSDIVPSDRFYAADTTRPVPVMSARGTFAPSSQPGIGYDPDLEQIGKRTVNRWELRS